MLKRRAMPLMAVLTALAAAAPAAADVSQQEAREWRPDLAAARGYAEGRAGQVSFAVFDMQGRLGHHRGGNRALMASTFKVMLMVAYLRQDSVDDRALNRTDKRLIRPMIRESDNGNATTIRDMLGQGPIENLADRARMKHFRWNAIWGYCQTSARDQAFFLRNLRRYVPDRHWDFAKRQLARIVPWQRWGIGQVDLPPGWKLHFKGGWGSGSGAVDHQVALLRNGKRRVGAAVMTEGNPSHSYGKETLRGVFDRLLRHLPS
jgi:Beta-lactamase enzyme family